MPPRGSAVRHRRGAGGAASALASSISPMITPVAGVTVNGIIAPNSAMLTSTSSSDVFRWRSSSSATLPDITARAPAMMIRAPSRPASGGAGAR
jgi:hypothetical protein